MGRVWGPKDNLLLYASSEARLISIAQIVSERP